MNACIPMGIQVVIDDVGWWCGEDGSARGEPYRTGCARNHVVADYAAIVELGRRLGMRPQAAMILCEWDRTNLLRELPSSTWMGQRWDNSRWVGPWLEETAALLRDQAAHIELTLHGVGHEFWAGPGFTRAEWHDRDGRMRPEPEVRAHLDYFRRLLDQNGLGGFPVSFVPAAFLHRFGSGLARILAGHRIRYISTPYRTMFRTRETEDRYFGIEDGLLTVDRGNDLTGWRVTGGEPSGDLDGPVCGMHWPNLLHADPARNSDVVDRWVRLLSPYDSRFDRMLAPDTASGFSQLVYHRWTSMAPGADEAVLDFRKVDESGAVGVIDSFFIKVKGEEARRLRVEGMEILDVRPEDGQLRLRLRRTPGQVRGRLYRV